MELTRRHLAPIFEAITDLLSGTPGQLEAFEPWASEQAMRLRRAAEQGHRSLFFEVAQLREELTLLTTPVEFERMLTESHERFRFCQRQWLTGLLDLVDDLVGHDRDRVHRAA